MTDKFVATVNRIRQMQAYQLTREEIHDQVVCTEITEEDFFLAWHAAQIMEE